MAVAEERNLLTSAFTRLADLLPDGDMELAEQPFPGLGGHPVA